MNKLMFRVVAIGVLLLYLVPLSFAAGKGKGKSGKKATTSEEVPFNADIEKLPAKFFGNNLITIFTALARKDGQYDKNEFETNEAFQERLKKLDTTTLTGKLKYNSTVAFPLFTSVESSYDADNETMTISIPMTLIQDSDLYEAISYDLPPGKGTYSYSSETINGHAIEVFSTLTQTKKFTGSNAFGVKVKITGKIYDTFAVALKNDNNLMKYGGKINFSISMPPEEARAAKASGQILLVGELLHPYIGKGTYHSSATIDTPIETLDRIRYVAMKLTDIWYYSVKNGEIFHKQEIKYDGESEPVPEE
jgi:hypothetical protein